MDGQRVAGGLIFLGGTHMVIAALSRVGVFHAGGMMLFGCLVGTAVCGTGLWVVFRQAKG